MLVSFRVAAANDRLGEYGRRMGALTPEEWSRERGVILGAISVKPRTTSGSTS